MIRHRRSSLLVSSLVSGCLYSFLFPNPPASALPSWQPIGRGIPEPRLILLAVDPRNDQRLYTASTTAVYQSTDRGRQWHRTLHVPGGVEITMVAVDPFNGEHIVVATTSGLFRTTDGGRHWGRVLRGAGLGSSACDSLLFHPSRPQTIFVGAQTRLLISHDGGQQWTLLEVPGSAGAIHAFALHPQAPQQLYVAAEREVLELSLEDHRWRSLFRLRASAEDGAPENTDEPAEEPQEEVPRSNRLTSIAVDPQRSGRLFLGSTKGAYVSDDGGATWQPLTQLGLGTARIDHLIVQSHSPTIAYVATPRGVARYHPDQQRWEVLYAGMPTNGAHHLGATTHGILAATDQGVYALDLMEERLAEGTWPSAKELLGNFVHEPTIEQVQQTAIAYAEVQPDKISRWRRQARWRAVIPTFSVGASTDLTDFRHWDSGPNPDALLRGERDIDWSTNVNWNLADFIWSTDQTSIDVRSKLMVQLRDDILDQVTRTYFERRRLQLELMTEPPTEPKIQLDKELRIQELTATLDGLTGGWFSKELERRQAF